MQEVAAGAGSHDDGQFAGAAIERVAPAILGVAPGDRVIADTGRICIDGRMIEVHGDLPRRTAGRIGAGHRQRARRRLAWRSRKTECQCGNRRDLSATSQNFSVATDTNERSQAASELDDMRATALHDIHDLRRA